MDSLGDYLQAIGKIPLLTPAEEIVLARDVQVGLECELAVPPGERNALHKRQVRRGQKAKKRMIEANLRLVVSVAKKYVRFGLDMMDLIQEGSLGLSRAVEKFDPERGYKFSTYAYWWIRQAMTRALDTQSRTIRVPLHLSEIHMKIRRYTREMQNEHGRKPTYEELAEYCGRSTEQIREVIQAFTPISSLDKQANDGSSDSDRSCLVDLIPDEKNEAPTDYELEDTQRLNDMYLSRLTDREKEIIEMVYGLGTEKPMKLSEIGKTLINNHTGKSVSRERVRQIKEAALRKMRFYASKHQPPSIQQPQIPASAYTLQSSLFDTPDGLTRVEDKAPAPEVVEAPATFRQPAAA